MNSFTFFITSLIIILLPGTGAIYTISSGIAEGKKASILAALGCTAGIIPHLCLSIALSSLLEKMNSQAFNIIKIPGALYLLYLGTAMILSNQKMELTISETKKSPPFIIRRGVFINLLNPKLTLFFFSFLPQYAGSVSRNYMADCLLFGFAFMFLTLMVFMGYGILAGSAKEFLTHSPGKMSLLQKSFGMIFVIFALQLALSSL